MSIADQVSLGDQKKVKKVGTGIRFILRPAGRVVR